LYTENSQQKQPLKEQVIAGAYAFFAIMSFQKADEIQHPWGVIGSG
tara:strand:+ start:96 stop:233 length:138 start_codon:yes stop_codon:yes gene_type:complete